jgi:hypothetical protein
MLLVSALRQGQNPAVTLERLKGVCGVWRSTVKRWQRYFQELFAQSVCYRRISGQLMGPIAEDQLPAALLERFYPGCGGQPKTALVNCLKTLAQGP